MLRIIAAILLIIAFILGSEAFTPSLRSNAGVSTSQLKMGLFDNIKFLMSDEAKEAAKKRKEEEYAEQMRLQEEIYARRTDPDKMEEYEKAKIERRMKYRNQKREWEIREEKVGEDGTWSADNEEK
mmetsp:Transcript_2892/g.2769  ORF Transcript_2892/g.2769 Transcript_2892/m.2769 type:complete len:126 (+) Transcript_2892:73-450(+)